MRRGSVNSACEWKEGAPFPASLLQGKRGEGSGTLLAMSSGGKTDRERGRARTDRKRVCEGRDQRTALGEKSGVHGHVSVFCGKEKKARQDRRSERMCAEKSKEVSFC